MPLYDFCGNLFFLDLELMYKCMMVRDMGKNKKSLYCNFMTWLGKLIFPKRTTEYEHPPKEDEVAIFAANHSGAVGPSNMIAWFPKEFRPWSTSCLFDKKVKANYIFHDIFFGRSKKHKRFFRFLSKIVAKMLPPLFAPHDPIFVYRNSPKIATTFRESVDTLKMGKNLVIFPENPTKFSEYVSELYSGFVDIARIYYHQTGKIIKFYPVYVPADIKKIMVGVPIEYNPENDSSHERLRISEYLKIQIDALGRKSGTKKFIPFMRPEFYEFYPEFVNDPASYWSFCNKERSE